MSPLTACRSGRLKGGGIHHRHTTEYNMLVRRKCGFLVADGAAVASVRFSNSEGIAAGCARVLQSCYHTFSEKNALLHAARPN